MEDTLLSSLNWVLSSSVKMASALEADSRSSNFLWQAHPALHDGGEYCSFDDAAMPLNEFLYSWISTLPSVAIWSAFLKAYHAWISITVVLKWVEEGRIHYRLRVRTLPRSEFFQVDHSTSSHASAVYIENANHIHRLQESDCVVLIPAFSRWIYISWFIVGYSP